MSKIKKPDPVRAAPAPAPLDHGEPPDLMDKRAAVADARAAQAQALERKNAADQALSSVGPASFADPVAYADALALARKAASDAADTVAFWTARLALAEEALRPAEIAWARSGVDAGVMARRLAHGVILDACRDLGRIITGPGNILEAINVAREAQAGIDECVAELRSFGEPLPRVHDDLAVQLASFDASSTAASLHSAARLIEWLDAARVREAERAEFRRRQGAAANEQRRQSDLRGENGPEAMKAAQAQVRAEMAKFYGRGHDGSGLEVGVRKTIAELGLAIKKAALDRE